MKRRIAAKDLSVAPHPHRAVVVGGSMAGMLAAKVLSGHFEEVTVLERDQFPEGPTARKGVPQGRHAHGLLDRGRKVLEEFFPGFTEEIARAGARVLDHAQDFAWMGPFGWYVRCPSDIVKLCASRDLIDRVIRGRVTSLPNVQIHQGIDVVGLIRGPGEGTSVAGVRLRARPSGLELDQDGEELAADLVVVADGRNSRLPDWLTALGFEAPHETVVNSFQGYASRYYRPPADNRADWSSLYIQQAPPANPRGGLIFPVEGGRWMVSLVGGDCDYPPTDEAGFLAFARSLRSPALYQAIVKAEPLSPIAGQRATENRLRHYDRLARFPDGVVAVGDAVCAFNPVYGQGMTVAALEAEVLDCWLQGESSRRRPGRSRDFQRCLAQEIAIPWQISSGADYQFRFTDGPPQGRVAQLAGRYIAEVMRTSTRRPWVRRRLGEVLNMLRPRSALFSPGVLARLTWDWLAGERDAGCRRVESSQEEPDGGSRLSRRSGADLDVKSATGGRA